MVIAPQAITVMAKFQHAIISTIGTPGLDRIKAGFKREQTRQGQGQGQGRGATAPVLGHNSFE